MSFDWEAFDQEHGKYECENFLYRKLYGMYCQTCEKNRAFNRFVNSDRYECCTCKSVQESNEELEISGWSKKELGIWRTCDWLGESPVTIQAVYQYTVEVTKSDIRAFFAKIGRPEE